jgi:hypothetical protein
LPIRRTAGRPRRRERPIMGDRRPPSKLGEIQPDHWLAEYTSELLDVLHVLGRLVALERRQADLLDRISAGVLISWDELLAAGVTAANDGAKSTGRKARSVEQPSLL